MRLKFFNPEKELKKLNEKYTKKHLIISLLILIVMVSIGSSYAIFNIEPQTHVLIRSKVSEFSTGDIKLFVIVDGEKQNDFPAKDNGYVYEKVTCQNGSTATWDNDTWQIKLSVAGPDECTINFKKISTGVEFIENLLASNSETMNNDDPEGNVRYMGANPNNYVLFNDELWRIIGVFNVKSNTSGAFEKRIKIIRDELLGDYSWDSSASSINSGRGVNEWSQADIMSVLNNGAYWNRTSGTCYNGTSNSKTNCDFSTNGLTLEAKELIDDAVWNIGTLNEDWNSIYSTTTAVKFYNAERSESTGKICTSGNNCNDNIVRKSIWVGKVGLMYPSDYGYATSGGSSVDRQACLDKALSTWNNFNDCKNNDWLINLSKYQWTLTPEPNTSHSYNAYTISLTGYISGSYVSTPHSIRPVVYLKSSVKIYTGDGTVDSPYVFQI